MSVIINLGPERRKHPRLSIKTEIILFGSQSSFRTYTKNISLNGVLLGELIPRELTTEILDIVLVIDQGHRKCRILLQGIMVGAPFRTARLTFINIPSLQFMKLQDLLTSATAA